MHQHIHPYSDPPIFQNWDRRIRILKEVLPLTPLPQIGAYVIAG